MKDYRHLTTTQEITANASEHYTPPLEIPVFTFNFVGAGATTPRWSPPYDIILTKAVATGSVYANNVMTDASYIWLLKQSAFGLVFIDQVVLGSSDPKMVLDLGSSYSSDTIITPYDNLYAQVIIGGAHSKFAIQLYGERARKL
jgi:hypothetical protein